MLEFSLQLRHVDVEFSQSLQGNEHSKKKLNKIYYLLK
jgi:hypothetical protein